MSLNWHALLGVAGLGVAAMAVAGCATARPAGAHRSAGDVAGAAVVRKTITIDPQVGETFAPAPRSARPRLTARQAWARYTHDTVLPSSINAQLGLLTLPTGPGGTGPYTAHNELTYGYSSTPSGCVTMNPRVIFPPSARCIMWQFLDANTGREIDSTWQILGHPHMLTPARQFTGARGTSPGSGWRA